MRGALEVGRPRWPATIVVAVALVALGATGAWWYLRRSMAAAGEARKSPTTTGGQAAAGMAGMQGNAPAVPKEPTADPAAGQAPLADVTITLTKEAVDRAGIVVAPVRRATAAGSLRLPGVVEANEYRQVVVTPLVAGRVTRVAAALGDRVTRGQTLAEIYSPELADAQTRFLTMRAELEAAHQELRRTERLVEIGAASKQELERVRAQHEGHATDVESARARLVLLGLGVAQVARLRSAADMTSTVRVPAPLAGVVTKRDANVGVNAETATALFTVVDLSTVWVIGDLYERDFSRVRVGSAATITTTAYPDLALPGKVSYIDPQLSPDTRTAKLRVEVANRDQRLRLGMYADMSILDASSPGVAVIPRTAVQSVGDRQVVYVADTKQPGTFIERDVRLGDRAGDDVQVVAGLTAGDVVVVEGTFYLRAERERLGLRAGAAPDPHAGMGMAPGAAAPSDVQTATVLVGEAGFEPSTLTLRKGVPARITFKRTSDKTCATEVVFPDYGVTRALPLNEAVTVEFTAKSDATAGFACGMNMLRGTLVVK